MQTCNLPYQYDVWDVETCCLPDNGLTEPLLQDFAVVVHSEDDGESETILAWNKTAKLLTESRGKHWHSALDKVDTGGTLASITIQGSVRLDEVGHIGDVNTDIIGAILVVFDRDGIVNVLGRFGIDGEYTFTTQVLADLQFPLGDPNDFGISRSSSHTGNTTHDQGMGGRHFRTLSVKSSVGKLQSFRRALVSTSMSPIGPSSSTRVPKGWRELMG